MHQPITDGTPGAASTNRGPRRGPCEVRGAVAALRNHTNVRGPLQRAHEQAGGDDDVFSNKTARFWVNRLAGRRAQSRAAHGRRRVRFTDQGPAERDRGFKKGRSGDT